ncbi:type VI secretion system accessory protein TagJ [Caballeronia ptereochthonis]|uniref:Virulence protein, SciE type n=1 Tax=Caballeronia ptereochthonis TaxID=1777144 RepID=A0A158A8S8_9BURK|nr:type VI secretion system accessory protein TagJ [Caballeronia ptereochthonis]SAK54193.1 virulence protein, SciE type [Caballeronia ptereochthonis]
MSEFSKPRADMGIASGASLAERIESLAQSVRAEPAAAAHRWPLFQMLCLTGEWERALLQLQVLAQLDQSRERTARTYRDLIRAERWRERVMLGALEPAFVYDDVDAWMRGLLDALRHAARGEWDMCDEARLRALDMAPLVSGFDGPNTFQWIGDGDSRLGPVCEFFAAGGYRWIALSDVANWRIPRPTALIDLVWAPCALTLRGGAVLHGFMPARYSGSTHAQRDDRDELCQGSKSVWQQVGRTGVVGLGRKTWTTDAGDFGIFELAECSFGDGAPGANPPLDTGDTQAQP